MTLRTRFAPSPTGLLHVGNAYSALQCARWASEHHAELLLRIEDIDHTRCRDIYRQQLIDDLLWLGIRFDHAIVCQQKRLPLYQQALLRLEEQGLIYPCFCTRKQIQQEIERMGLAPHAEDMADLYPGTCKHLNESTRVQRMSQEHYAWRLNADALLARAGKLLWQDDQGHAHPCASYGLGDLILGRKDIGTSYHIAVVVDDAAQDISHVIRGEDLRPCTPLQVMLQHVLGLPHPTYRHHTLLLDADGRRLAKRNHATTLTSLREQGISPDLLCDWLLQKPLPRWRFTENERAAHKLPDLRIDASPGQG